MKTNLLRLDRRSLPLLLSLAICLPVAPSFGQVKDAQKFSVVPAPIRERLIQRLNLFIEYDHTGQHEKKYDLFSEAYVTVSWKNKAEYVKFIQGEETKGRRERFITFNVSSVKELSTDAPVTKVFNIKGIAKFQRGNKAKKGERAIEARFHNGEWHFSDWLETVTTID